MGCVPAHGKVPSFLVARTFTVSPPQQGLPGFLTCLGSSLGETLLHLLCVPSGQELAAASAPGPHSLPCAALTCPSGELKTTPHINLPPTFLPRKRFPEMKTERAIVICLKFLQRGQLPTAAWRWC